MTHVYVSKLRHHWFRYWLVTWPAPSHYLNQCWNIVDSKLRKNFSEILSNIYTFPFTKMHLQMSSANWRKFCIGLNVLNHWGLLPHYDVTVLCQHCFSNGWLAAWWHLAITWTNDDLLDIRLYRTCLDKISGKTKRISYEVQLQFMLLKLAS